MGSSLSNRIGWDRARLFDAMRWLGTLNTGLVQFYSTFHKHKVASFLGIYIRNAASSITAMFSRLTFFSIIFFFCLLFDFSLQTNPAQYRHAGPLVNCPVLWSRAESLGSQRQKVSRLDWCHNGRPCLGSQHSSVFKRGSCQSKCLRQIRPKKTVNHSFRHTLQGSRKSIRPSTP